MFRALSVPGTMVDPLLMLSYNTSVLLFFIVTGTNYHKHGSLNNARFKYFSSVV